MSLTEIAVGVIAMSIVATAIIFALSKAGLVAFSWWLTLALAIFLMVFGGITLKIKSR